MMGSTELRECRPADLEGGGGGGYDNVSSSGISSTVASITSNNNNYATLTRKRNFSPDAADGQGSSSYDEYEMERIRQLMAHVDGDRRSSASVGSYRASIDPSLMSSVFVCVLILIFSISVYAFASLYRAVMKRVRGG